MIVATHGRTDLCDLLLSEGADAGLTDPEGRCAADLAASAGFGETASYLRDFAKPTRPATAMAAESTISVETSGWEADEGFVPPTDGRKPEEDVLSLQSAISTHRITSQADDWALAEIDRPDPVAVQRSGIPELLQDTIKSALASGWTGVGRLHRSWPSASHLELRHVTRSLQESGVRLVADRLLDDLLGNTIDDPDTNSVETGQLLFDSLDEMLHGVREGPADRYIAEISRFSAFTPEQEKRIFTRPAAAKEKVLEALAQCPWVLRGADAETTNADPADDEDPQDNTKAIEENNEADSITIPYAQMARAIESLDVATTDPSIKVFASALERYRRARDRAMEGGLQLVPWMARRYCRRGFPLEDLIQEGNLGLLRAAEKFDPSKGNRFSTYATWWIRQGMLRALDDQKSIIRISVHVGESRKKVERIRLRTWAAANRDATVLAVAAELDIAAARVERIFTLPVAVNRAVPKQRRDPDTAPPDRAHNLQSLQAAVAAMLMNLPPRSERILRMRFGFGPVDEHTLEEVGEIFDVARERIRQIEAKPLQYLQHPNRSRPLQAFL